MDSFLLGVLKFSAAGAAVFLFLTPFQTALQISRDRKVGLVKPLPFAMMALNCTIWSLYGVILRDWVPLVASNVIGVSAGAFALTTFHRFAPREQRAVTANYGVGLIGTAAVLLVGCRDALVGGHASGVGSAAQAATAGQEKMLGSLGVVICVLMFASPLVAVRDVLRSRSTAGMSVAATMGSLACTSLWSLYGLIVNDIFIWGPNGCGLLLSLLQLSLFLCFGFPSGANGKSPRSASPVLPCVSSDPRIVD